MGHPCLHTAVKWAKQWLLEWFFQLVGRWLWPYETLRCVPSVMPVKRPESVNIRFLLVSERIVPLPDNVGWEASTSINAVDLFCKCLGSRLTWVNGTFEAIFQMSVTVLSRVTRHASIVAVGLYFGLRP